MSYPQQTFMATDQSVFQRNNSTGQYTISTQPSSLPSAVQQTPATPQRQINGQFIDPIVTSGQSIYERQEYVNGYQQQVSCRTINLSDF